VPQFRDRDTVVFLGDSITHSRKWHRYVMDAYLTRFPERHIRYVNAGSSGDTAKGALKRLDRDVLSHRPNVVVVMLGMNDVKRELYAQGPASEATIAERREALKGFRDAMIEIATRLRASSVRDLIFVVSSPYDDTSRINTPNLPGVNEALRQTGITLSEIAPRYGAAVVDLHGPMTAINAARQSQDPAFTLVGSDRVHPGDPGQLLMAYLFLRAQAIPALVTETIIDAQTRAVRKCFRCQVDNASLKDGVFEFDMTASALPFPVEAAASPALDWAPIQNELGRELLCVAGLRPGRYTLMIDSITVGGFDDGELARCVDLSNLETTPQLRQAREVTAMNEQRRQSMVLLRDFCRFEDAVLGPAHLLAATEAEQRKYVAGWLEELKARNEGQHRYFNALAERYFKNKPAEEQIRDDVERTSARLAEANQPSTHRYRVVAQ
jgi:lysophospholipase L1-like esterase